MSGLVEPIHEKSISGGGSERVGTEPNDNSTKVARFLLHFFVLLKQEAPRSDFIPILLDDILFVKLPGLMS
jgi:hypothetical protein